MAARPAVKAEDLEWSDEDEEDPMKNYKPKAPPKVEKDETDNFIEPWNDQMALIDHEIATVDHKRSTFSGDINLHTKPTIVLDRLKQEKLSPKKKKPLAIPRPTVSYKAKMNLHEDLLDEIWFEFLEHGADESELVLVKHVKSISNKVANALLIEFTIPLNKLTFMKGLRSDDYIEYGKLVDELSKVFMSERIVEPPKRRLMLDCCVLGGCIHESMRAAEEKQNGGGGGADSSLVGGSDSPGAQGDGHVSDNNNNLPSAAVPIEVQEDNAWETNDIFTDNVIFRIDMIYNRLKHELNGKVKKKHVKQILEELGMVQHKTKLPQSFWNIHGEILLRSCDELKMLISSITADEIAEQTKDDHLFRYPLPRWLKMEFKRSEIMLYEHHFGMIDVDAGGDIDVYELQQLLQQFGKRPVPLEEAQAMLDEYDIDGGGTVDFMEFMILIYKIQRGTIDLANSDLAVAMLEAKSQLKLFEEIEVVQREPPSQCEVYSYGDTPVKCDVVLTGPREPVASELAELLVPFDEQQQQQQQQVQANGGEESAAAAAAATNSGRVGTNRNMTGSARINDSYRNAGGKKSTSGRTGEEQGGAATTATATATAAATLLEDVVEGGVDSNNRPKGHHFEFSSFYNDAENFLPSFLLPKEAVIPYVNGTLHLQLIFHDGYPYRLPEIIFKTRVYSINIITQLDGNGRLLHVKDMWDADWTISRLLNHIVSLLNTPDISYLVNPYKDIYEEWTEKFEKRANRFKVRADDAVAACFDSRVAYEDEQYRLAQKKEEKVKEKEEKKEREDREREKIETQGKLRRLPDEKEGHLSARSPRPLTSSNLPTHRSEAKQDGLALVSPRVDADSKGDSKRTAADVGTAGAGNEQQSAKESERGTRSLISSRSRPVSAVRPQTVGEAADATALSSAADAKELLLNSPREVSARGRLSPMLADKKEAGGGSGSGPALREVIVAGGGRGGGGGESREATARGAAATVVTPTATSTATTSRSAAGGNASSAESKQQKSSAESAASNPMDPLAAAIAAATGANGAETETTGDADNASIQHQQAQQQEEEEEGPHSSRLLKQALVRPDYSDWECTMANLTSARTMDRIAKLSRVEQMHLRVLFVYLTDKVLYNNNVKYFATTFRFDKASGGGGH